MNNYQQPGDSLTLTAPSGGVTAGLPVQISGIVVVPTVDALVGVSFVGKRTGVFSGMPKATGATWTPGQLIYWDAETDKFTTVAGDNRLVGYAMSTQASGDTTGTVLLDGAARPDETT